MLSMSVCLPVCPRAYLRNYNVKSSPKFMCMLNMAVAEWLGPPWWRCDMSCTSGFIDDVMFAHNGQE